MKSVPPVTGGPNLVKLLTVDCKDVTGGILNVEKDPVKQPMKCSLTLNQIEKLGI